MASNPYQTDSNRPLLYNNPPPPPAQPYNPYTDRNNYNQIPSFNNTYPNNPPYNPPYNPNPINYNPPYNPNPSFNANPPFNPSANPNPYTQPVYRNPSPVYPPQPVVYNLLRLLTIFPKLSQSLLCFAQTAGVKPQT